MSWKKNISTRFLVCKERPIERSRRGGQDHRIYGDTAGSWFQKPAISLKKSLGGYRSKTQYSSCCVCDWAMGLSIGLLRFQFVPKKSV